MTNTKGTELKMPWNDLMNSYRKSFYKRAQKSLRTKYRIALAKGMDAGRVVHGVF